MQAGIDFTARCMAAEALANGGSGGTSDYTQLTNKPSINNVELSGNKTSANLGLQAEITGNVTISSDNVDDTGATNLFVTSSEKSTWNGKQDALAFDGIYDASTNKAATESTVYNEAANATLASGYTTDSSEVSITSATNINDAVEQLDYRTQTNKTNISSNWKHGKNYLKLTRDSIKAANSSFTWNGYTTTAYQVTFTINEDLSITMSGTASATFEFVLISRLSNTFYLPTGDYYLSGAIGGSSAFNLPINRNVSGSGTRYGADVGSGLDFTVTDSTASTGVWIAINSGTPTNTTFKPMIISKADKDNGNTDYQPYAMSNVELTEKVDLYQPVLKRYTNYSGSATYSMVSDCTLSIPYGDLAPVYRVSAMLGQITTGIRGIILSKSNDSSTFDTDENVLCKAEQSSGIRTTLSCNDIWFNSANNPINVYCWVKCAGSGNCRVYTIAECLG